jgi:hypothetical protein
VAVASQERRGSATLDMAALQSAMARTGRVISSEELSHERKVWILDNVETLDSTTAQYVPLGMSLVNPWMLRRCLSELLQQPFSELGFMAKAATRGMQSVSFEWQ